MTNTQARLLREMDLRLYQAESALEHAREVADDVETAQALLDHERASLGALLTSVRATNYLLRNASEDAIVAAAYAQRETAPTSDVAA